MSQLAGAFSVLVTLPPKGEVTAQLVVKAEGFEPYTKTVGNGFHSNEWIRLEAESVCLHQESPGHVR